MRGRLAGAAVLAGLACFARVTLGQQHDASTDAGASTAASADAASPPEPHGSLTLTITRRVNQQPWQTLVRNARFDIVPSSIVYERSRLPGAHHVGYWSTLGISPITSVQFEYDGLTAPGAYQNYFEAHGPGLSVIHLTAARDGNPRAIDDGEPGNAAMTITRTSPTEFAGTLELNYHATLYHPGPTTGPCRARNCGSGMLSDGEEQFHIVGSFVLPLPP